MEFFVKIPSGETIPLQDLQGSDSVAKVKAKVQATHGTPAHQQRLLFAGFPLEDSRTLGELSGIQFGPAVTRSRVELHLELCRSNLEVSARLEAERVQRQGSQPEPEPEPEATRAKQVHVAKTQRKHEKREHEKRRRMQSLAVEHEAILEREKREDEMHALACADKPLLAGTRIAVVGHGVGSYVSCVERWVGANDHTIEFDDGCTKTLQLRELQWTVFESKMDALLGLEPVLEPQPETKPEPEPEPEPEVLPEGSPPSKGKDEGRKKKKKSKKKKNPKAAADVSSNPPSAPPPPPGPPPPPPAPPPKLGGAASSSPEDASGSGRGDLLAAIQNGGIGMLKKADSTESTVVQIGRPKPHESQEISARRPKPRQSQYGPPWDKKPPAGLDIIGEM